MDDSFEARYPAAGGEFIPAEPKALKAAAKPKRRRASAELLREQASMDAVNVPHGLATIDETTTTPNETAPAEGSECPAVDDTNDSSDRPKRHKGPGRDGQAE